MARVTRQFMDDFELVTSTWVKRGEHTQQEVEALRARLRVEMSPGPGLPQPVIRGEPLKGWLPRTHEERVQCYTDVFSDWADRIRRDEERAARIRAEVRASRPEVVDPRRLPRGPRSDRGGALSGRAA